MGSAARKLRREIFNYAREANLSGWRSLIKGFFSKNDTNEKKLRLMSEKLAHFSSQAKPPWNLIQECLLLAKKQKPKEYNSANYGEELSYCLVLKRYVSDSEKGILIVSFENQLDRIIDLGKLGNIQSKYHILFIPSWTGLYSPALFKLASLSEDRPFFVLPVHDSERELVSTLGEHCVPLPFNAASWVNQEFFDEEVERDIDCLIVANFATFKRHWLLFKALKGLPESVTAVCVGVPLGRRTADSIRQEALDYGVSDRVEIVENPSQENLRLYFQRAKVFCAMSYREGSFIAVAEALMSGTPVVMFKNAHVGTKSLITPGVGALVGSVSELRERVMEFMEFRDHEKVRRLARESISAQANCRKLNTLLSDWSTKKGLPWTVGIEPFYSMRLSFYYFDQGAEERLRPDYEYLASQGLKLSLP